MSRFAPASIVALFLAAGGCVVEATDPPGSTGQNGQPDAAVGTNPGNPDAGPGGGDTDADPAGPDAGPTAMSVLMDFGNCMRLADWEAAGLGQLALVETNQGTCASCHSAGQNSNYLNADSTMTFNMIRTYPYILRYASVDGQLNLSASDDLVVQGQQAGHPTYTLPADLIQGITDFFDATNAHYIADDCPGGL